MSTISVLEKKSKSLPVRTELVSVDRVVFDPEIYPRVQATFHTAYVYSVALQAGCVFPPVELGEFRGKLFVLDGKHRLDAYGLAGVKSVQANIQQYRSKRDMFLAALQFNNAHGKALTVWDKTLAFGRLRGFKVDDDAISILLGTPVDKFSVYVDRLLLKDGKLVPIKRVFAEALSRELVSEVDVVRSACPVERQNAVVSNSCMNAFVQLNKMLCDGIVPLHDPDVQAQAVTLYKVLRAQLEALGVDLQ